MEHYLKFNPLIKSSYCQTIFGTAIDLEMDIGSKTHYVHLKDGDIITVELSIPNGWCEHSGAVFLVHGLCGSHKSQYMRRIARRCYDSGMYVGRINLKGCGSGKGLAKGIYHSGSSDDVLEVIKNFKRSFPFSSIVLVGFSLGANISLKLSGELDKFGSEYLSGIIAVSPPVDLLSSARLISRPCNKIYSKYFLRLLMNHVNYLHQRFKDIPHHNLPSNITLDDFDELYIAPRSNFSNVFEYYNHCSSKRVICNIDIPTKILFSKDDPIIESTSLDNIDLPNNIDVFKTEYGGHLGFIGFNVFKEFRWMDNIILSWIESFINAHVQNVE